jgi:hypothetical protein
VAYMNQDKKKVIKANLDKVLKPLGIKYSLRVDNHMAINCTLRSGKIDFIRNCKAKTGDKFNLTTDHGYMQVNQYWLDDHFDGQALEVLKQVSDALKSADYYDRSDSMIDYFDTAYYMHLNVGAWDKPYQLEA